MIASGIPIIDAGGFTSRNEGRRDRLRPGEDTIATILIIEDDDALRDVLRRAVERAGHQVIEAEDGAVGLDRFREMAPDLVLTDLFMPEKEGIETILELRAENPTIPIVAMSGELAPDDPGGALLDASLLGASATLAKPFDLGELYAIMQRLLPVPSY